MRLKPGTPYKMLAVLEQNIRDYCLSGPLPSPFPGMIFQGNMSLVETIIGQDPDPLAELLVERRISFLPLSI